MKLIPVGNNMFAKVDDNDYKYLSKYIWHTIKSNGNFITCRNTPKKNNIRHKSYLHREIMNPPPKIHVDHINHDTLDNRRCNLRICYNWENAKNCKLYKSNKSGFKGVCFNKSSQKWSAYIKNNNVCKYLGLYDNKIDAARKYDEVAQCMFGKFALTNKMLGLFNQKKLYQLIKEKL